MVSTGLLASDLMRRFGKGRRDAAFFIAANHASITLKDNACLNGYTVIIMQAHFTTRELANVRRK